MRLYWRTCKVMEENQSEAAQTQSVSEQPAQNPSSNVSFPSVGSPKKSGGAKTLLILGALILIGILGFAIFKSATKKASSSTGATPIEGLTNDGNVSVSTPAPSSTPSTSDRSGTSIEVQNGTGIAGEAAYLQTQLSGLGYSNVKTGNAPDQTGTTTEVTFANSVPQAVVDEITQKLKSIYQSVTTTTSSSATTNVVIVTGLRKGATSLPSPTETPVASPEASTPPPAQ